MTGITRSTAAKVIAGYFHTDTTHVGGCYDSYSVRDNDGRMWKIMRDASVRCENRSGQNASSLYSVEFVTPICNYDDIETIQELVRKLRGAGARVNSSCGLHCHINAAPHTPKTLRNIVNIMAAKEDLLYKDPYKGNVAGSQPEFSFHFVGTSDKIFLFEAPIDMLSYISMHKYNWQEHSYAASCSVSYRVLFQCLKDNPNIKNVYLCFDNDEAGQKANKRISDKLNSMNIQNEILIPTHKDWNEDLKFVEEGDEQICPQVL